MGRPAAAGPRYYPNQYERVNISLEAKKTNSIFNSDTLLGAASFLIGLWWLAMSIQMPSSTATDGTPGAATFPIGISILVMVISVIMMVTGAKKGLTYFNLKAISKENAIAILISLALFVLFLILWNQVHYIAASFAMTLGLALVYKIKPVPSLILAAVYSVSTYYVFTGVLKVMLDLV